MRLKSRKKTKRGVSICRPMGPIHPPLATPSTKQRRTHTRGHTPARSMSLHFAARPPNIFCHGLSVTAREILGGQPRGAVRCLHRAIPTAHPRTMPSHRAQLRIVRAVGLSVHRARAMRIRRPAPRPLVGPRGRRIQLVHPTVRNCAPHEPSACQSIVRAR